MGRRSSWWIRNVEEAVERAATKQSAEADRFRLLLEEMNWESDVAELSTLEQTLTEAGFLPFRFAVFRRGTMTSDPDICVARLDTLERAKFAADGFGGGYIWRVRDLVSGEVVYEAEWK